MNPFARLIVFFVGFVAAALGAWRFSLMSRWQRRRLQRSVRNQIRRLRSLERDHGVFVYNEVKVSRSLREMEARLAELVVEMRGIDTEAGENLLSDDQQTRWTARETEHGALVEEIRNARVQMESRRAIVASSVTTRNVETGDGAQPAGPEIMRRVEAFDGSDIRKMSIGQARDHALKALELRGKQMLDAAQTDDLERKINKDSDLARRMLVTENDDYRSAWVKLVTKPTPILTQEEGRAVLAYEEYRAMSEGTTTAGGFGIPILIDPSIILTSQGLVNPFFQLADVKDITTNVWKGVSSAGMSWAFQAEGATVADGSPTLAQPTATVFTARGFIPYSIEVDQDYPDFAQEMATLLDSGYNDLLLQKFSVGSGSGEPNGVVTTTDADTNVEVIVTTSGAFGVVDVYKVWEALPQRFRANASWMMTVLTNDKIRQMGTALGMAYSQNLTEGTPGPGRLGPILGHPAYESPYFPDFTGSTGSVNILVVGDFSNYVIARRAGMSVELVQHLVDVTSNRPTGQRGWFAYARIGGDVKTTRAFRLLVNAT